MLYQSFVSLLFRTVAFGFDFGFMGLRITVLRCCFWVVVLLLGLAFLFDLGGAIDLLNCGFLGFEFVFAIC